MSIRANSALVNAIGSVLAVVVALLIGAVVIAVAGHDPWEAYKALAEGALGSRRGRAETLVYAAPLILGGLAFAVAARAGMFNIGIEGQLVMGGFAAALVGASDWGLPSALHIALAVLAAIVAGGIWGLIPGVLKATTGAHEVITTIMLNYLAFRLITYSIQKRSDWLPVDEQVQGTDRVLDTARLPILLDATRLHSGYYRDCRGHRDLVRPVSNHIRLQDPHRWPFRRRCAVWRHPLGTDNRDIDGDCRSPRRIGRVGGIAWITWSSQLSPTGTRVHRHRGWPGWAQSPHRGHFLRAVVRHA